MINETTLKLRRSRVKAQGPVVQSRVKLIQEKRQLKNSLLIYNDMDSSKLFSLNNLTLAAFKLPPVKLAAVTLLNKKTRSLGQHLTQG